MTPRALLTAIGATALVFAFASGIAAGSTPGAPAALSAVDTAAVAQETGSGTASQRLAAWNDPCDIAV